MKLFNKYFLVVVLLMAHLMACNQNKQIDADKYHQLMAFNVKEQLWKRHQNITLDFKEYRNGKVAETLDFYVDKDIAQWNFSYGTKWFDSHTATIDSDLDNGNQYYVTYLYYDESYHEENLNWAKANEILELTEIDKIIETKEKGDTFTATVEYSNENKVKEVMDKNAPDLPDDLVYEAEMAIRYKYVFKNNDLSNYDTYLIKKGKKEELVNHADIFYDKETYDPFKDGEPFANYQKMMKDPTQVRQINVVYDVDTENEKTITYQTPKYAAFKIFKGETKKEPYIDRACTTLYERERNADDLTLYIPSEK